MFQSHTKVAVNSMQTFGNIKSYLVNSEFKGESDTTRNIQLTCSYLRHHSTKHNKRNTLSTLTAFNKKKPEVQTDV